jgi:hypothetical protein
MAEATVLGTGVRAAATSELIAAIAIHITFHLIRHVLSSRFPASSRLRERLPCQVSGLRRCLPRRYELTSPKPLASIGRMKEAVVLIPRVFF